MMGKKAGVLVCSLTDMVKIHQPDSCLKVQVTNLAGETEGFLDVYPIQGSWVHKLLSRVYTLP